MYTCVQYCYKMCVVHCGIHNWYIMGFVQRVYQTFSNGCALLCWTLTFLALAHQCKIHILINGGGRMLNADVCLSNQLHIEESSLIYVCSNRKLPYQIRVMNILALYENPKFGTSYSYSKQCMKISNHHINIYKYIKSISIAVYNVSFHHNMYHRMPLPFHPYPILYYSMSICFYGWVTVDLPDFSDQL